MHTEGAVAGSCGGHCALWRGHQQRGRRRPDVERRGGAAVAQQPSLWPQRMQGTQRDGVESTEGMPCVCGGALCALCGCAAAWMRAPGSVAPSCGTCPRACDGRKTWPPAWGGSHGAAAASVVHRTRTRGGGGRTRVCVASACARMCMPARCGRACACPRCAVGARVAGRWRSDHVPLIEELRPGAHAAARQVALGLDRHALPDVEGHAAHPHVDAHRERHAQQRAAAALVAAPVPRPTGQRRESRGCAGDGTHAGIRPGHAMGDRRGRCVCVCVCVALSRVLEILWRRVGLVDVDAGGHVAHTARRRLRLDL